MDDSGQISQVNTQSDTDSSGRGSMSDRAGVVVADDQQPVTVRPHPEQAPVATGMQVEAVPMLEVREQEIPAEVVEYVEKVEKENLELGKEVVHEGQPVIQSAGGGDKARVVLPMTQDELGTGMRAKVTSSARWLAEWCVRIIKKLHGRVFYATGREE